MRPFVLRTPVSPKRPHRSAKKNVACATGVTHFPLVGVTTHSEHESISMKTYGNRPSSISFHLGPRQTAVAPVSKPAARRHFQRPEKRAHGAQIWKFAISALGAAVLAALSARGGEFH